MPRFQRLYKELPINQIERDPDQPRKDFGTEGDMNAFLLDIKEYGIDEPLKVMELEPNRYLIIDGHRRYICAQKLKFETVPCMIYPKLQNGMLESRRYKIQNSRRSWRPLERSEALERIKAEMGFRTIRELADHLELTETLVANSLQLRKQKMDYIELMEKYGLAESYRIEFVRLKQKLRKIRHYEVDDIIANIFDRVQHKIIRTAKDFRRLGSIFLRATANEQEIYNFLSNPDMTVGELEQRTLNSGMALHIEKAIQQLATKKQEGIAYSSQEEAFILQLRDFLLEIYPVS
jgi:ParB/RepB/Spo0J family partition protein